MSDFRKLRMTAKGRELLALAHQGTELQLLNIVVGNGAWPQENQEGDPPAVLVSQKKVLSVSAIEQSGEVAQVRGMLTNTSMTQGFAITEIGVTALHPVDGEILYMADYCELAKSSYIPDNSGAPVEIPLSLDVLVASSQEVTLQIDDRFFSATKQDIDDHDAEPEAHQPLVDRLHVSQPAITSPTSGQLDVIETPTFQCAVFESHFAGVAHSHSQWQVDVAAGDWTTPVHDSGEDAASLVAYTLPSGILTVSTVYKVRVRHRCGPDGLWSEWSDPITFTTKADFVYVEQPTNQSPADGATGIGETPTLQGSAFAVHGGSDTHAESEFRVLQGGSVVHTSIGLGAVTSYNVPAGVLLENTAYTFQCRYRGTAQGWGDWSSVTGFTTLVAYVVGDDAVTYDPTIAADYVASTNLNASTGTATADGGQGFFDTEFQGEAEGYWTKGSVESRVRAAEQMTLDGASTTSSLVLTSSKTGLLADGGIILANDGTSGSALTEITCGAVVETGAGPYIYTCTGLSPAPGAVPDKVFLPAPLYFARGDGSRVLRPDGKVDFTALGGIEQENVKGSITQLTVDTANASGHFDAAKLTKVVAGCRVVVDVSGTPTEVVLTSITGDGTATDAVIFTGTLATGSYGVTGVFGTDGGRLVGLDGSCKLLVHSDTTDGSTTFEDSSATQATFTVRTGTPNHATAQKKFGATSMYFAGSEVLGASQPFVGSADCTLEAWVYFTDSVVSKCLIGQDYLSSDGSCSFLVSTDASGYWGTHFIYGWSIAATSGPALNTWYHVAVVRSGSTVTMYIDGSPVASGAISGGGVYNGGVQLGGAYNHRDGVNRGSFSGYLDEVRVDNGVARYLAAFTPPTAPYVDECPTGAYYTLTTDKAAIGLTNVTDINSATATETVGGTTDKAYYALSLDGHTYKAWTGSTWRDIVSDVSAVHSGTDGVWYYRSNADIWTPAYADNAQAAISQAVVMGVNNQMSSATLAGIADVDWPDVSSAEALKVAVALYTSDSTTIPEVESIDFDCDFVAGAMGDFELADLASASWVDDAGTMVVTEVSEEIEPTNTFKSVALGIISLPNGAQITFPKINLWKQGA